MILTTIRALAAALLLVATAAFGQIKIGLMVSATGPTSAIGIPQKNTGALLPTKIGDATVEYIQLDDGGTPTSDAAIAIDRDPRIASCDLAGEGRVLTQQP